MKAPRVLIAGIGNVFRGDDGFGVAVAAALNTPAAPPLPAGVVARDYGIRGLHLAYELLEPPGLLVLVDAVVRGEPAGTLFMLEPTAPEVNGAAADPHGMNVPAVLAAVAQLGGHLPRVLIVGCEPLVLEETMGLSPAVARAVQPAAQWIRKLVDGEPQTAGDAGRETSHAIR
jgi:hydrogenase maturation protease